MCGGDGLVDVMVLSSAGPIRRVCTSCGATDVTPVAFRRWVGRPVYMVDPSWVIPPPRSIGHPYEATSTRPPVVTVWCGPPATSPLEPSPEDLLRGAGLDPLVVFL